MWISNDSGFASGNWESYSTTKLNWALAGSSDGTKTVYVKFRDFAGNVSSTYSTSIAYISGFDYVNVSVPSSLYVSGSTISLSGGCNSLSGYTSLTFVTDSGATSLGTCTDRQWAFTYPLTNDIQTHL